jgi:type IV pilus assembly protein PilC
MPVFKYKVINHSGQKVEGTYSAANKDDVLNMIKLNHYYPVFIKEVQERETVDIGYYFTKVSVKDIALFCRQFYTMLNAGVSIVRCIDIIGQQTENKKLKKCIQEMSDDIRKGSSLSEAMTKRKDIFPELLISMVNTGEVSGNLDLILLRMSQHYEKENKINNKIRTSMIYPVVLSILAITVVTFLLTFVMPIFFSMFTQSGVALPGPTRFLLAISNGIKKFWYIIIAVIAGAIYGIKKYGKTSNGKTFYDSIKLELPVLRNVNQKIIVSRFTRTFATMLESGVSVVQSLQEVSKVTGNVIAQQKIMEVREKVLKGTGISEPMKETGIFPPMLYNMIKIGEDSGTISDILNKTADFYDDELETALQNATALLEPILIIFMGVIIGFVIVSMVMPMFSMYSTIK